MVMRQTLQALHDRGANLCKFKNCRAKLKKRGDVSYRKAIIEQFLHTRHVRIYYLGALSKLGDHHVDKFDVCQLDAIALDTFANGDLLGENPPWEENPPFEEKLLDEK